MDRWQRVLIAQNRKCMQARLGEAGAAHVVEPKQLESTGPEAGETGFPKSATAVDNGESPIQTESTDVPLVCDPV